MIILQLLATDERHFVPSEITDRTIKARNYVKTVIQRMRIAGLADVTPSDTDKRYLNITITAKGREKLTQAGPISEENTSQMMSKLGKTDMVSMNKIINTLKQNAIKGIDESSRASRT